MIEYITKISPRFTELGFEVEYSKKAKVDSTLLERFTLTYNRADFPTVELSCFNKELTNLAYGIPVGKISNRKLKIYDDSEHWGIPSALIETFDRTLKEHNKKITQIKKYKEEKANKKTTPSFTHTSIVRSSWPSR
jgi:hypothetical protein